MTCQTCGSDKQENYCPQCGEKKFDPHSLTLKHVIEEGIEGFTHADHNIFHTLNILLFKPGQLSLEYVEGRRVKFMKPLGLFLVINLLFFLLGSQNAFNQPLHTFLNYSNYVIFGTQEAVDHALHTTGKSFHDFETYFNASMKSSSKAYVILLVPIYALMFGLLRVRGNRSIIEHLIFSLHFLSVMLLAFLVGMFFILFPLQLIFNDANQYWADRISVFIIMGALGIYLSIAFKRFYKVKNIHAILAAIASTLFFVVIIQGYRILLFYKIVLLAH